MYDNPQPSERLEDGLNDLASKTPRSGRNLPPGLREATEEDFEEVEDTIPEFSE